MAYATTSRADGSDLRTFTAQLDKLDVGDTRLDHQKKPPPVTTSFVRHWADTYRLFVPFSPQRRHQAGGVEERRGASRFDPALDEVSLSPGASSIAG